MNINRNFGIVIRKLREEKGWSQEKFAEYAEIHRTYVSEIESGKRNISLKIAEKLAKCLDLYLSDLIKETEKINELQEFL